MHGSIAIGNPWVKNPQWGETLTADVAHAGCWSKSGRKMEPGAHKTEATQQVFMAIVRKAHFLQKKECRDFGLMFLSSLGNQAYAS